MFEDETFHHAEGCRSRRCEIHPGEERTQTVLLGFDTVID
jgi:hypothetical protein